MDGGEPEALVIRVREKHRQGKNEKLSQRRKCLLSNSRVLSHGKGQDTNTPRNGSSS